MNEQQEKDYIGIKSSKLCISIVYCSIQYMNVFLYRLTLILSSDALSLR